MNKSNLLQNGQVIEFSNDTDYSFVLPKSHLLILTHQAQKWTANVYEINQEWIATKLLEILSEIKNRENATIKYLLSTEPTGKENEIESKVEKIVASSGIALSGKMIKSGAMSGTIDFTNGKIKVQKKIRVMIVDDSKTIRDLLTRIFSSDDELEVIAAVENPRVALTMIKELKPDLITLDIHMPEMNGVELLKAYLPEFPIPTVMISSITIEEGTFVLDALDFGAVDYIQKPSFNELKTVSPMMIEKIKSASKSKVKSVVGPASHLNRLTTHSAYLPNTLILIGSSTGGTEALKQVFKMLPPEIPPTLVVQHIPAVFSKAFADRLNQICPFAVLEAKDGDRVIPNQVLIAPGGFQMELVKKGSELFVKVSDAAPMNRHKPSVDYLFHSAEKYAKEINLVAAILTGMGADGAKGIHALHKLGAKTIAQDEETSVVFGMPKEAIKTGGIDSVLPINRIAERLVKDSTSAKIKR